MKTIYSIGMTLGLMAVSVCHASDGAFEINQACADVGCFPGDAAGLPVTITTSGTYALTGNLNVTGTSTDAIAVAVNDVTIDMKGFRITGPISCSGTPTTCTPAATGGTGIDGWGSSPSNLVVRNGSITGMGTGLLLSYDGRAESIKALRNGIAGIRARSGAAVIDSTGTSNGGLGIEASLMIGCVVSHNRQYGITTTGNGALIKDTVVRDNDDYGVYLAPGASIVGAVITGNNVGIIALGESQVVDSLFRGNTLVGIQNTQGTLGVARSTFVGNNGGGLQWGGTVVQLAPNICGTSTTCP